jgi:hypothetical protein
LYCSADFDEEGYEKCGINKNKIDLSNYDRKGLNEDGFIFRKAMMLNEKTSEE